MYEIPTNNEFKFKIFMINIHIQHKQFWKKNCDQKKERAILEFSAGNCNGDTVST